MPNDFPGETDRVGGKNEKDGKRKCLIRSPLEAIWHSFQTAETPLRRLNILFTESVIPGSKVSFHVMSTANTSQYQVT